MRVTSRSFHYCQLGPKWRQVPQQEHPGNPAKTAHAKGIKTGTHHTDKTIDKTVERGRKQPLRQAPTLKKH